MENIKSILILLFLCLVVGCTSPDNQKEVSLINQAESMLESDPQQAYALLDSVEFPEELSSKQEARWCMLVGKLADSLSTPLPYTYQLDLADRYFKRHGSHIERAQVKLYLGRANMDDSKPDLAMQHYLEALHLALSDSAFNLAGYICTYMADVYEYQDAYMEAKEKSHEASLYFKKANNKKSEAYAYFDMGKQYAFSDSLDMAYLYILCADSIMSLIGDSTGLSIVYNGLGNVYLSQKKFHEAELYLLKSIAYSKETSAPSYSALFQVYLDCGKLKEAQACLDSAKIPTTNAYTHVDNLYQYSTLAYAEGEYKEAYDYLSQYVDTTYSDLLIKNELKLIESEKRYNHTKATLENIQLKKEKYKIVVVLLLLILILSVTILVYVILLKQKKIEIDKAKEKIYNFQKDVALHVAQLSELSYKINILETEGKEHEREDFMLKKKEYEIVKLKSLLSKYREQLLNAAPVSKKLRKYASTISLNQKRPPLTPKDWKSIIDLIDSIYPYVHSQIEVSLSEQERYLCYLFPFKFDAKEEALILSLSVNSIYKYRQRIKEKLNVSNDITSLYEYFSNSCLSIYES